MIPLFKSFFFDETAFIRFLRAAIFAGGAVAKYAVDSSPWVDYLGIAAMAGSLLLSAGEPNAKPVEKKD
jgi:hypothetical protein